MTFMCEWGSNLNNTDLIFESDCLELSSSISRLSGGRLLEKVSVLYIECVNYRIHGNFRQFCHLLSLAKFLSHKFLAYTAYT